MKHNHPRLTPCLWLTLIIIGAFSLACTFCFLSVVNTHYPEDTHAPEVFPDTDIVYAVHNGLGFVNSDGSLSANVDFAVKIVGGRLSGYSGRIVQPVITEDNQVVIARVYPADFYNRRPYYLAIWRNGALPVVCKQWGEQMMPLLSADQEHIFIQSEQGLALYALANCGTDEPPIRIYEGIVGIPSPNLQYVVYTKCSDGWNDNCFITVHDLHGGSESIIGEGNYPSWSRDSQWLAYTGKDGIYVVSISKGTEPQRVLLYLNPAGVTYPAYCAINSIWPPEVSWSPDGRWLVYHKLTTRDYVDTYLPTYAIYDYSLYKLNIETGEEIKIIDGGMYPYWRWPAEQPGE